VNRMLALVLLALLDVPACSAQAQSTGEQELIRLERQWADMLIKRDRAGIERIYAEEYLDIDPDGVVTNKAQDLANVASGALKLTSQSWGRMTTDGIDHPGFLAYAVSPPSQPRRCCVQRKRARSCGGHALSVGLGAAVVVGGRPPPRRAVEGRVRTSIEQTMPVFFPSAIRGVGDWQQRLSPSKM
jgi:uncharacterized protein DUF4440